MRVLSIAMPFSSERELRLALGVLTAIDMFQMGWHRLPPLYKSGIRFQRESAKTCWAPVAGGCEDWLTALELLRQGKGDCEDLGCYRTAELRRAGERASAIPIRWTGGWHIVVRRASGVLEDPSVLLGMPTGPMYFAAMRRAAKEHAA